MDSKYNLCSIKDENLKIGFHNNVRMVCVGTHTLSRECV